MKEESAAATAGVVSGTVDRNARARRRLRKFLERSEEAISGPVSGLRDEATGLMTMTLTWESDDGENYQVSKLEHPELDKRTLDSVLVECRVFFMVEEDCYLPSVLTALQQLNTNERARRLRDGLRPLIAQIVDGNRLVGAQMYSGRLEMDNGLGPGRLLGSDQITMDYINGVIFHQDDDALARLENVSDRDTVRHAVVLQMNQLLRGVETLRVQILHDIEKRYISMDD